MVSGGSTCRRVCTGGKSSMTNNGARSNNCRRFSRHGRFG